MNKSLIIGLGVTAIVIFAAFFVLLWRKMHPAELKSDYFAQRWKELQKLLRDKNQWAEAILEADRLLDEALKKKHIKGKSMGERLVKAQRLFSDNDSLWFGHKLRTKLDADPTTRLREGEVKQALVGIRQALKDVGALPQ